MEEKKFIEDKQISSVEKKFLSYLFHDKKYIALSLGKIGLELLPNYNYIYTLLASYFNKFKDIITDDMIHRMFLKKNIEKNHIIVYESLISELRNLSINNEGEFDALVAELKEYYKRKNLLKMAEVILDVNPLECSSKTLERVENEIKKTAISFMSNDSEIRKEGSIKDTAEARFEYYNRIKTNPEIVKTIPTGFEKIDTKNGGFRPGELVYIIGRKGDGKSVLMLNLAHNIWNAGFNVIIFSLEISKEDYERRFDSRAAGVPSNGIKMGSLSQEEEKVYKQYIENQRKGCNLKGEKTGIFYTVDVPAGCTPAFIDSKLDVIEQTLGIKFDVVITDYAGIMQPNVFIPEKRHQQGQIALDLKRLARKRECIVISGAQKSRAGVGQKDSDSSFIAESDQVADQQ